MTLLDLIGLLDLVMELALMSVWCGLVWNIGLILVELEYIGFGFGFLWRNEFGIIGIGLIGMEGGTW